MKQMKKWMAVLLTLVMTLAMGITAVAEETGNAEESHTITIQNEAEGHTYEAYQIFTGDLTKKDGKDVLSNIRWGSGVTDNGKSSLGDAAKLAETLKTEADAKVFAEKVSKYLQNPTKSTAVTGSYTISGLSAGYYLVKDQDNSLENQDDFYTAYIMEVVGEVTAEPKGEKPHLDKEIKHNDDGTWGVVGDNQIGDTVEFRTISTVPDTTGYTTYTYQITDTMSAGLTSNVKKDAQGKVTGVTIKVNDSTALDSKYYTVTVDSQNSNKFTIKVDILNAVKELVLKANDKLYAYYTGVLNKDAEIYDEGNQDNAAYLEYSNNPNDSEDKGKTPEEKVYDWTFKMGVNKVDEKNDPLTGATFVLSQNSKLKVADFKCNDAGTPTVITDLIGLVKVEGGYRVATDADEKENIIYSIEAGSPVIKGLDDEVDYYLYETKAPEHYNLLSAPVQFKIKAEYKSDGSAYTKVTATIIQDGAEQPATDNLQIDVVNQPGANLPRTGGMGTTVFYAAGTLLVICAGVLLVVRKRMDKSGK